MHIRTVIKEKVQSWQNDRNKYAKGYRATNDRLPVIPLATRSQHVIIAYDQVVRPHRCYRPSGGLPRVNPRTRHMWTCPQLSGARGVDNGGVSANNNN